ncbi:hypothetical protein GCL60_07455 [Silvanigrella paludirubra]|uniref:Lipoprotein n=1 Tax=Silvanigrella paludirubra TaxID=2499159 RepID=A0A6N6VSQ5_9BACT|nr:hypothetical protein [Silvanigrella paludirubra]KAB8038691.1 hypothetical protein GCL60_07455 [Silvanigrella paludirubra]
MKYSVIFKLACPIFILTPFIMGCKGNTNSNNSPQESNKNELSNVETSIDLALIDNIASDKSNFQNINVDTFSIKGLYGADCKGRKENESWLLTKNKIGSTLILKQGNSTCKLTVTGIKYSNNDNTEVEYALKPKSYILSKNASEENLEFHKETNSVSGPDILYSKMIITPDDFSTNPIIKIYLSELNKRFELNKKWNEFTSSKIFKPEIDPNNNIKFIEASDYKEVTYSSASENPFKIEFDIDNKQLIYLGHLNLISTIPAKKYIIVKGDKVQDNYKSIHSVFIAARKSYAITAGKNLKIDAHDLRIDGELPDTLDENRKEVVKIIFATSESGEILNSYQVFKLTIQKE